MELIKKDDRWDLYNKDGHKIASTLDGCVNKLSLKNCQAIERGYDLEELATHAADNCGNWHVAYELYKEGFQKALEILSDKKFSEEQLRTAILFGEDNTDTESFDNLPNEDVDKFIQSLQQTEWDVEIEMDTDCTGEFKYLLLDKGKPKLDADGCLILKRK